MPALSRDEQVVDEVTHLVADVIVIIVLAGHDDLACLLGELLQELVLLTGEEPGGIGASRVMLPAPVNGSRKRVERLCHIAILHVCGTHAHPSPPSPAPHTRRARLLMPSFRQARERSSFGFPCGRRGQGNLPHR